MLLFVYLAEIARTFIEDLPVAALLVVIPMAIIVLSFIATGIAVFIDQQMPSQTPK
jgi:hypothetical protein